jgi:hypothetical protein
MSCPEKTAEGLEIVESGPGNDLARHGSKPPDVAPGLGELLGASPTAPDVAGFRRQYVRMMLNGVAAC